MDTFFEFAFFLNGLKTSWIEKDLKSPGGELSPRVCVLSEPNKVMIKNIRELESCSVVQHEFIKHEALGLIPASKTKTTMRKTRSTGEKQ
jgi:hypothetical protein